MLPHKALRHVPLATTSPARHSSEGAFFRSLVEIPWESGVFAYSQ